MPVVVNTQSDTITNAVINHDSTKSVQALKRKYPSASEQPLARASEAQNPTSEVCTYASWV